MRTALMAAIALIGADLVLAGAWDGASPAGGSVFALAQAEPPRPPGTVVGYTDQRAEAPAFAESPWAQDYFREFREQDVEGVPYVQVRYRDRSGRFVNVEGNVRRSYTTGRGPIVWFFGGSTMFGEGQRDAHTIPSEIARLAESDGHPIQAVNFGVQADSNFQSVLRFEAALASDRPRPDLVVFYDGANEVSQHVSQPATDQPQYYQGPGGPSSPDEDGSLFQAWWRTSLAGHVWERTTEVDPSALPAPAEVLVDQITTVYGRGIALARQLASDAGVAFASFFQPAALYDSYPWVEEVRAALPTGTIDLADALDGPGRATYFDAVHTNEAGARLVAEAMYPHLTTDIAGPS
ncbi:MAG: SGNH/GDSL hydrolase family protein [Acidimicrobiales bacterium]|nr:SGNH/GDSL hydrolase family protein [Acidimicrobiales bacterium]